MIDTQNKTVSPRDVTVVSRTDSTVVLAGGVKNGEQVVSAGAGFLSDGDLIRIVAASGSAP